jgi:hypothetical protein
VYFLIDVNGGDYLKSGLDVERTLGLEAWADNVLAEAKDKYDGLD